EGTRPGRGRRHPARLDRQRRRLKPGDVMTERYERKNVGRGGRAWRPSPPPLPLRECEYEHLRVEVHPGEGIPDSMSMVPPAVRGGDVTWRDPGTGHGWRTPQ